MGAGFGRVAALDCSRRLPLSLANGRKLRIERGFDNSNLASSLE